MEALMQRLQSQFILNFVTKDRWKYLANGLGTTLKITIGALLIGVSRVAAAEFTFFLAVPVMFGLSGIKILKFGLAFTGPELILLLIGMAVAFGVSLLVIKFLMAFIRKHDFRSFGVYRVFLGFAVLAYFLFLG